MIEQVYFRIHEWKDAGVWREHTVPTLPTYSEAKDYANEMFEMNPHMVYRVVRLTEEVIEEIV